MPFLSFVLMSFEEDKRKSLIKLHKSDNFYENNTKDLSDGTQNRNTRKN